MGIVSGKDLTDHVSEVNGQIADDRTYCVVALERIDSVPITFDYKDTNDVLVSPYIEGLNPAKFNIFTLDGSYTEIIDNGILYRIVECTNIEKYADHTIYLGVSDGRFYNSKAFLFDEATRRLTRNEDYNGVNALFTLPIDASKAESGAVETLIDASTTEGTTEYELSKKK